MIAQLQKLPNQMKAAQGKNYGDIDEMLTVEESVPVPSLKEDDEDGYDEVFKSSAKENGIHPMMKSATKADRKTHMLIKTLAVALAPGDIRVLSGKTRQFQGPLYGFPYIPGGDCCGIVIDPGTGNTGSGSDDGDNVNSNYFQKGDIVAARFTVAPRDAMAEYARVSSTVCEKVDMTKAAKCNITPEGAAVLAGASPAVALCDDFIRPNERVLILGAGGGIGSHFCQLAKRWKNASYICGVGSQDTQRLLDEPINCDDAIDYTKENIFESKLYQQEPFDTIIDLSCGGWLQLIEQNRNKGSTRSIVKPASMGGRYITITPDTPSFDGSSLLAMMCIFVIKPMWRSFYSRIFTRKSLPTFTLAMALPETRDIMTKTLQLAYDGKLVPVIDGPYPMTTDGIRKAFRKLESRHAKGKVVVKVSDM
jgi:NADPH:quinone reductase-like Zn-dependent oxidoreductase